MAFENAGRNDQDEGRECEQRSFVLNSEIMENCV